MSQGTIQKVPTGMGCDYKEPRISTDGKDGKLGYQEDMNTEGGKVVPGTEAGDFDYRTSKWKGDGQGARK